MQEREEKSEEGKDKEEVISNKSGFMVRALQHNWWLPRVDDTYLTGEGGVLTRTS